MRSMIMQTKKNIRKISIILAGTLLFLVFVLPNPSASAANCPNGVPAPDNDTNNCAWSIRCYRDTGTFTPPEAQACIDSLSSQRNQTKCFKLKVLGNPEHEQFTATQNPCPEDKGSWNIRCFLGTGNDVQVMDCPTSAWEFASTSKCYKYSGSSAGVNPTPEVIRCPEAGDDGGGDNGDEQADGVKDADVIFNPAGRCEGGKNCISTNLRKITEAAIIGVGVIITVMIVIAGIQYMTARDNAQAVQAAKSKIMNAFIALVAFIFLYAFLQWLVPGGLFS